MKNLIEKLNHFAETMAPTLFTLNVMLGIFEILTGRFILGLFFLGAATALYYTNNGFRKVDED